MVISTFSLSAHSWHSLVSVSLAPGTQWSQKPTESLPAAKAPRTKGAASAVVAAVCRSVRRVSRVVFTNSASHHYCVGLAPTRALKRLLSPEPSPYSSAGCVCGLDPHEAFELRRRPIHRLVDRLPGLRAMRDHLGHRRLCEDLVADPRRRRRARNRRGHVTSGRIVVEGALGRPLFFPGLEIVQFFKGRDVVAMARRNQLLDRGPLREMQQQAVRRRLVARETPDRPEIRVARIETGPWGL